jgi:hypothetical protein
MRKLSVVVPLSMAVIAALVGGSAMGQGWSPTGAPTSTPTVDCTAAYNDGRQVGVAEGIAAGQAAGYAAGQTNTVAVCQSDPTACGISLGACLAAPTYGETEPNDNIVTADPLLPDTKFWGQAYGINDQDWYYVTTSAPNQNLTVNFSVPTGTVSGWEISIRDAAGNIFARFDAGGVPGSTSAQGDISYRVTLGLVGTYYITLKPTSLNYEPYNLAALLQNSPLETQNYIVGFYDSEIEPNDAPEVGNPLATGVAMFGVINLNFAPGTEVPDPEGDGYAYSQGLDEDWYVYLSPGNEIISLEICNHTECSTGNWFFELYDVEGAAQVEAGAYATPLLAVNSDMGNNEQYVVGLGNPGAYYLRVSHKRLLTAACAGYTQDLNNDGLAELGGAACGCGAGEYECELTIANPSPPNAGIYPPCPDGGGGGESPQCAVGCVCTTFAGVIQVPENAITSQYNFSLFGSGQPPNTAETDAFQEFLGRPNPYQ